MHPPKASGTFVAVSSGSPEMTSALKLKKLDELTIPYNEVEKLDDLQHHYIMEQAQMLETTRVDFPNNYEAVSNTSPYCVTQDISYLETGRPEPIRYIQKAVIQNDGKHIRFKGS